MEILQPPLQCGVRGFLLDSEDTFLLSSCAECSTAILFDPLVNLRPIEIEQIALATAASRMNGRHAF